MSERFPGSKSRRFLPEVHRPTNSANPALRSDDIAVIEEAEFLLSQFIKHSDPGSRGSQTRKDKPSQIPKSRTYSYTDFGTTKNEPVSGWRADSAISEEPSVEISHKTVDSPQNLQYWNSSMTEFPPNYASPAYNLSTCFPAVDEATLGLEMQSQKREISHPPTVSAMDVKETVKPCRTRRSGRPRSGPTNYYENFDLSLFETTSGRSCSYDSVKSTRSTQQRTPEVKISHAVQSSGDTTSNNHDRYSLVYASPFAHVFKLPFKTELTENMTHLPYSPQCNPSGYTMRFRAHRVQHDETLHVDFGRQELTALLEILSFYGIRRPSQSDMALADQVIETLSIQSAPEVTVDITRMCALSQLLPDERIGDSSAWLMETLTLSTDGRNSQKDGKNLIAKVLRLDLGFPNSQIRTETRRDIHRLSGCLQHATILRKRCRADIESFIADAKKGRIPTKPYIFRVTPPLVGGSSSQTDNSFGGSRPLHNLLQQRELGGHMYREISSRTATSFKVTKTWKGASNDVIVLAWSPDGTQFAAGATAQCDEHNMEYNRGNNLVFGDLNSNILEELPDHCIVRPPGRAASSRTVNDARLFMSVTSMEWHQDTLLTASYDNTVKLWKFPNNRPRCCKTLVHDSKVQVMARSRFESNILATGASSIRLWKVEENENLRLDFPRQRSKREMHLVPTSLAWGTIPLTKNILLAGMSEKGDGIPKNGLLAVWRLGEASFDAMYLSPNSQNIFDITWHPTLPLFATASSAPNGAQLSFKDTRSVVRLYEPLTSKMSTIEFECPALDINDVTICPTNSNYVTASCTDGLTYVWDSRNINSVLHRLPHGPPLNQMDETLSREEADVGVRLALWGEGIDQFYTGSSDGFLKYWNILRSPEDVLVKDVACFQEEIMCGALSGDKSNLLVGDAAGGIHLLSSGPVTDCENLQFNFRGAKPSASDPKPDCESGVSLARQLLSCGKLTRHPLYGAGKGPRYDGPFAAWARPEFTPREKLASTALTKDWQVRQLDGLPLEYRPGLDEQTRADIEGSLKLARIRNQAQNEGKRKRASPEQRRDGTPASRHVIDLCSDEEGADAKYKRVVTNPGYHKSGGAHPDIEIIDLTGDTDLEDHAEAFFGSDKCTVSHTEDNNGLHVPEFDSLLEELEEDHWWPGSGEVDANIQVVGV